MQQVLRTRLDAIAEVPAQGKGLCYSAGALYHWASGKSIETLHKNIHGIISMVVKIVLICANVLVQGATASGDLCELLLSILPLLLKFERTVHDDVTKDAITTRFGLASLKRVTVCRFIVKTNEMFLFCFCRSSSPS